MTYHPRSSHISWFTLVEILIAVTILWVLVTLLFRTYTTIGNIALKIEHEKNIHNEVLFTLQTLQNLADRNTIDYEYYTGANTSLATTQWRTSQLALSGLDGSIQISVSGDCMRWNHTGDIIKSIIQSWPCSLQLVKQNERIELIDTNKVVMTHGIFKIIPLLSNDNLYTSGTQLNDIWNQWFWVMAWFVIKQYQPTRTSNSQYELQSFFNIKN
jgi:hypothetical protein